MVCTVSISVTHTPLYNYSSNMLRFISTLNLPRIYWTIFKQQPVNSTPRDEIMKHGVCTATPPAPCLYAVHTDNLHFYWTRDSEVPHRPVVVLKTTFILQYICTYFLVCNCDIKRKFNLYN
jgi:hypothetical protein